MIRLAIHGAAGRMGRRLIALACQADDLQVTAALDHNENPQLGQDAGRLAGIDVIDVPLASSLSEPVDVIIDFSLPQGLAGVLDQCRSSGASLVSGTTGLDASQEGMLQEAAQYIAVLHAPNMSLGVNLLFALAGQVATTLGEDYDIEIVEAHHHHKKDAPSGTAMGLARSICEATGRSLGSDLQHGREGEAPRQRREIGMHALRLGDVVGRHTAHFATPGEEVQLTHIASNRDVFVHGALRAARWIKDKPAGRYTMADVLGL